MPESQPQVLIAEDNPGLARALSFQFESSGFAPIVCADGQLAWEAFQTNHVQAIVSDQQMPRMSGIDLCRNVRSQNEHLPFFLVTGRHLELASAGIVDELNIHKVFGKPFHSGDLISAVRTAIRESAGPC